MSSHLLYNARKVAQSCTIQSLTLRITTERERIQSINIMISTKKVIFHNKDLMVRINYRRQACGSLLYIQYSFPSSSLDTNVIDYSYPTSHLMSPADSTHELKNNVMKRAKMITLQKVLLLYVHFEIDITSSPLPQPLHSPPSHPQRHHQRPRPFISDIWKKPRFYLRSFSFSLSPIFPAPRTAVITSSSDPTALHASLSAFQPRILTTSSLLP